MLNSMSCRGRRRRSKKIKYGLLFGTLLCLTFFPLRVLAAGEDAVTITQSEGGADISLTMGRADQEKITAVSVSLTVEPEDAATVEFQFSPSLAGTECGYIYNEETKLLDVYAASAGSLFTGENLNLGKVHISAGKTGPMAVEIGYREGSFHTANASYGSKDPLVENVSAPIRVEIGNASGGSGENAGADKGNGGSGAGGGSDKKESGSSEKNNMNQGLYDETTRFVNDPLNAEAILAGVISGKGKITGTAAGAAGGTAGALRPGGKKTDRTDFTGGGKVSVIDPKDGPSAIVIGGESSGGSGESLTTGGESGGSGEIRLDQEKGGAVRSLGDQIKEHRSLIIVIGIAAAIVLGVCIFFSVVERGRYDKSSGRKKKKKKKRKRRKKKSAKKKASGQRREREVSR